MKTKAISQEKTEYGVRHWWEDSNADSEAASLPSIPYFDLYQAGQHQAGQHQAGSNCEPTNTLGDYALVREIGKGGMGIVYEARQISLDRRVALKVLPFASLLDDAVVKRFQNEAKAAAHLSHPHLVPVYEVGRARGVHFYSMQFIQGQSLVRLVSELRWIAAQSRDPPHDRSQDPQDPLQDYAPGVSDDLAVKPLLVRPHHYGFRRFSTASALRTPAYMRAVGRLGVQAARALHHAHKNGIIHRDIKPSNLLLENPPDSLEKHALGKLYVADFGLARIQSETSITRTGQAMGTNGYMSPEQATGNWAVLDERTDIFSLGVSLYELLTLQRTMCAVRRLRSRPSSPVILRTRPPPYWPWYASPWRRKNSIQHLPKRQTLHGCDLLPAIDQNVPWPAAGRGRAGH